MPRRKQHCISGDSCVGGPWKGSLLKQISGTFGDESAVKSPSHTVPFLIVMDLFTQHDSGLDTLPYTILCPNSGMPDCMCGTHPSSPFPAEFNNCSAATLPWTEHPLSRDAYQPMCSNPAMPAPSFHYSHPPSAFLEGQALTDSSEKSSQGLDCACLREILLVSEQLERYTASKPGFKNLVTLSRRVIEACERYPQCQKCEEFLITTLCVTALRRTSAYYRELASAPQEAFALDERTFRCRVGSFETGAVLDEDTCKLVLCAEIERSLQSMAELENLLGPESRKAKPMGEVTLHYYQEVIKKVKNNLQDALDLLQSKDG
ncbi:hypothetical protein OIDMADRAFT_58242 [Oidiodendron maius Zn]|uniref:Uncharacterized protein n=1 Tax=Oidiodendron maius (strain Zn) TaxID=913774 RepID=A0A0C3D418_OIDMZ|nr:hypothetical protein OIDMADRAFT_58242 [Oidiodendron maius Zn]